MKKPKKYEPLYRGDEVVVTKDVAMPSIKWARGHVVSVQDNTRSPYKNMCVIWLEGSMAYGNPWYVYRHEIEKVKPEKKHHHGLSL